MNDELQTYIEPQLEARIVALVLGEASAFEAEELERLMSEKPELKAYRTGLKKIHGVVSEAHRNEEDFKWKLSENRRGEILAKIEERKRHKMEEGRRKRISGIAQRRLIYSCAACLALTLVILVLSQPIESAKTEQEHRVESRLQGAKEQRSSEAFAISGGSEFSVPVDKESGLSMIRGRQEIPDSRDSKPESWGIPLSGKRKQQGKVDKAMAVLDDALAVNFKELELTALQAGSLENAPEALKDPSDKIFHSENSQMADSKKPAAPAPSMSKAIVANSALSTVTPVPDVGIANPNNDFGDGNDFGEGFGGGESFITGGTIAGGIVERPASNSRFDSVSPGNSLSESPPLDDDAHWDFELTDDNGRDPLAQKDPFGFEDGETEALTRETRAKKEAELATGVMAFQDKEEGRSAGASARGLKTSNKPSFSLKKRAPVAAASVAPSPPASLDALDGLSEGKRISAKSKSGTVGRPTIIARQLENDEVFFDGIVAPNDGANPGGTSLPDDGLWVASEEMNRSGAVKGLEYLNDSIRTEASVSYEHTNDVDKVRRNLYKGESLYNLGLYDKAEEEFKETLRIDPYNKAARRLMERTSAIKSDYYRAAYDQTRAEMLMEVDRAWALGVPSESEKEFSDQEVREKLTKSKRELTEAKQGLSRLDDLPGSELSSEETDQVRRALYNGEAYYNLGLYDKAKEEFENTLKVDPSNKAAYRWMGKTASSESSYYEAALNQKSYGETDSDGDTSLPESISGLSEGEDSSAMADSQNFLFGVNEADSGRESDSLLSLLPGDPTSLAGERSVVSKVNNIIVPEVRFENATVGEALEVLRKRSVELDNTTIDESQKGLNLVVDDAGILDRKLPNIEMKNAPLSAVFDKISEVTGTTAIQDDFAVRFGREDASSVFAKARYAGNEITNAKLNQLILPEVQLNRASINEAVEFLKLRSIELDSTTVENGKKGFDVEIEEGVNQEALVGQLTLKNVPLKVAVEGIARQAGYRVRVEEGKVVFFADPNRLQKDSTNSFETSTKEKTDSTFSLNVSDVSFKLAKSALSQGNWPDASKVRPEEFVNALSYDDVKPTQAEKISCEIEQGSHPFMQQRNLMRVSMSTASLGRNAATPLRLTILLDQSGSMERVDRAESVQKAFALLAAQLNPNDEVTLVGFARTPRLLAERVKGNDVAKLAGFVANPLTEGGTNLEEALSTGLQLAKQQFLKGAQNRIILLTDGAANLGAAKPKNLASQVESMRRADIAFDACGVGADGLNDDVLSSLTKQGDGRYYFLDRPEDADDGFARQIAGALRPAAKNVKVQVLFNPERVSTFKLYGFEKHKLKKEDFRNDSVDAAEMAAEESGVALYHFEPMPEGRGDIGTVSVRFFDTSSNQMVERTWSIPYQEEADFFSKADPKLRLASVAALFAEKLKGSPVGDRVDLKNLRQETQLLRPSFVNQKRFNEFQTMLQQAGD
ncbi:MAG: von Willebrand factor type A domain-containing protein [Akkermansiaceae bacterium]